MFAADFKKKGPTHFQKWFVNYKVGDIVDIKVSALLSPDRGSFGRPDLGADLARLELGLAVHPPTRRHRAALAAAKPTRVVSE